MTTMIQVRACCSPDKQVKVQARVCGEVIEEVILTDGEETTYYAYDDRVIAVEEVEIDS